MFEDMKVERRDECLTSNGTRKVYTTPTVRLLGDIDEVVESNASAGCDCGGLTS
jgi:hypothetical protein